MGIEKADEEKKLNLGDQREERKEDNIRNNEEMVREDKEVQVEVGEEIGKNCKL